MRKREFRGAGEVLVALGALFAVALLCRSGTGGVGAVRASRLRPPYEGGRTTFPARGRAGVYLIYDDAGRLRYVGFSYSDLYKAMYRHFQQWSDSSRPDPRIVYDRDRVRVRVLYTSTGEQAARLERALIAQYQPMDNPRQVPELDPPAYASAIDAEWMPDIEAAPF